MPDLEATFFRTTAEWRAWLEPGKKPCEQTFPLVAVFLHICRLRSGRAIA
jgi:hypothetical protein